MNVFEYIPYITFKNRDGSSEVVSPDSLKELLQDGARPGEIEVCRDNSQLERPICIGFWLRQACSVQDLQRAEEAVETKLGGDELALQALIRLRYGNVTLELDGVSSVSVFSYSEFISETQVDDGVPEHVKKYVNWDAYIDDKVTAMGNAFSMGGLFYVFRP